MSHGPQANVKFDEDPIRPKGVVVDFPVSHVDPGAPLAFDLEMPAGSTSSTHAPRYNEWHLSTAEERTWQNQGPSIPKIIAEDESGNFPRPVVSGEAAPESPGSDQRPAENSARMQSPAPTDDKVLAQPAMEHIRPKRSWLDRWLFPDRSGQDKRHIARELTPGLIARFWNGGPPQAHPVRDISASGLYVVTEERWYLGTEIMITLTKPPRGKSQAERSITMHAVAVRHGSDGVGLEFVLSDAKNRRPRQPSFAEAGNREQFEQFMDHFRSGEPKQ